MEIQHLREFITLEQVRNYSRAADILFTTEPSLSRHIRQLEKELGHPLFERTTRTIFPTEFGTKYLQYAKRIIAVMDECEHDLLQVQSGDVNKLMIGVFGTVSHYKIISDVLERIAMNYPEYTVGTVQYDLNEQKERLRRQEFSLALVRESSGSFDDDFCRMTILREPLCLVIPIDDPLAQNEQVNISALSGKTITVPSEHMLAHRLFVKACTAQGVKLNIKSILREREFIQNFINLRGLSILCRNMAERSYNPATQVVREISPPLYEYINLLYLDPVHMTHATRNALRCFRLIVADNPSQP